MKALVVEDDFTSRTLIQEILKPFGSIHVAVDGKEAGTAVRMALEANEPYGLICLDIMLPKMYGQETLQRVRDLEIEYHIPAGRVAKIVMTTALSDMKNVAQAYSNLCDGYLI
jgi:two-component system, chemotaxis family, chemotaxis protein CheY